MDRVIDVHTFDVPLSRKLPALFRQLAGSLPPVGAWRERAEGAKLPDLIEDMDRAGVRTSLVVLFEETAEFFNLAARHPGRLFGLAYFDSLSPREGLERARSLCQDHPDLILGVETAMPHFRQDPRLRDFVPLYEFCLERALPIHFHIGLDPGEAAGRPTALGVLAATFPRLRIVCVHSTGTWHQELPGWLRRFPNLLLAIRGPQGPEAGRDGLPRTLRELVRQAGSRQLMFGSDWLGRDAGYFDAAESLGGLPWWQRRNLCWRTAARVYGARILGDRTTRTETLSPTR